MYFSTSRSHTHRVSLFPSYSLRRLVLHHRDACSEQGLDPAALADENDASVASWLRERAGLLPAHLADDLERIEDLTDEKGASTLLATGRDAGVDVRSLGLDAVQVAIAAFLDHRPLFDRAHGRREFERLRGASEFAGRRVATALSVSAHGIDDLASRLGGEFDARGRSAHCLIAHARDGARMVFTIAHGALVKVDECLHDSPGGGDGTTEAAPMSEGIVRYRPHRRDVVVYEGRAGHLRVRASDAATVRAYRRGFGELLFGDTDWFGDEQVVSLEPLARGAAAVEVPTPGIRKVRVVGLVLRHHEGAMGTSAFDSDEIWPYLRSRMNGSLADGELIEAVLRVWTDIESEPATVKVRPPHKVDHARVHDDVIRPYLEARGFLAPSVDGMAV